jgi:hypothetical protein
MVRPIGSRHPNGTSAALRGAGTLARVLSLVAMNVQKPEDHARRRPNLRKDSVMSLGLILVIILVIALLGGFSGRFGGYGYGYGHGGVGVLGVFSIVLVVLLLMGRL